MSKAEYLSVLSQEECRDKKSAATKKCCDEKISVRMPELFLCPELLVFAHGLLARTTTFFDRSPYTV